MRVVFTRMNTHITIDAANGAGGVGGGLGVAIGVELAFTVANAAATETKA